MRQLHFFFIHLSLIFLFIFYYSDASTRKYLSKTRIKSYILEVASEQQREIG